MSILIKNGRITTATDDYVADIYIEGETISAIGKNLNVSADEVIDASGKLVMPGGIDPHVHLDMPFMGTYSSDNYETGTRAALFGGTTTVIDFILQTQGKSLQSALKDWKGRSDHNAVGDYSFHMAVTDFNDETKKEIQHLIEVEGITSFKTFMAYKGALMIDDRQMIGLMEEVKKHGGLINVHATNGDMIDYLIAKHRNEGKLSPLYHYLSQPEITEAEASEYALEQLEYLLASQTAPKETAAILIEPVLGLNRKLKNMKKPNSKFKLEVIKSNLLNPDDLIGYNEDTSNKPKIKNYDVNQFENKKYKSSKLASTKGKSALKRNAKKNKLFEKKKKLKNN